MKIGIGAGTVNIFHLGGVSDGDVTQRMEYVASGDALSQSFASEHHATAGDAIMSPQVGKLLVSSSYYIFYPHFTGCS